MTPSDLAELETKKPLESLRGLRRYQRKSGNWSIAVSATGEKDSFVALDGFDAIGKDFAYGAWAMLRETRRKWFGQLVYKGRFVIEQYSPHD